MQHQSLLRDLGLSPNEARAYEALLRHGESTVSEISTSGNIHRRNAYDAMARLLEKGLCFQVADEGQARYQAVDPQKLRELIGEKQKMLEEALPALRRNFIRTEPREGVSIYKGLEGQKNIWRDMVRIGDDVMNIGAKGQWFDVRLGTGRRQFFKEANIKKMKFFLLFDHEVKEKIPEFPNQYPAPMEYRFLPKNYSTDSIVNIFGDYVVNYTGASIKHMADDTTFFVTRSAHLAESYRKWFRYMWRQSKR